MNQHIGEYRFFRFMQNAKQFRVIRRINVFDDTEDPMFDIDGPDFVFTYAQIGKIISHNAFTGQHRRRGLTTGTGIRPGKPGFSSMRTMDTHHEHMFGQPPFLLCLADSEAQCKLFEADAVARILGIDAVDQVFFKVDINPPSHQISADMVLQTSGSMQHAEKPVRCPQPLKFFISRPEQQVFAMCHVGRIGNLHTGYAESGLRRSQAEKSHQHGFTRHDAVKQAAHFGQPLFPVQGGNTGAEALPLGHKVTRMRLVTGLIMQTTVFKRIEMNGVTRLRKCRLFFPLQGQLADQLTVLCTVVAHQNMLRPAKTGSFGDKSMQNWTFKRLQLLEACFIHQGGNNIQVGFFHRALSLQ